jgi:hypothetical protein
MFDVEREGGDLGELDGRTIGELMQRLDLQERRHEARLSLGVAEAERRGAHREDGHSTIAGWCRALMKWSTGEAVTRLRVGRLMLREPTVTDALETGTIGVAQARELARAAANPRCGNQIGTVLPVLLQHAGALSFDDFRLVVRRWEMLADTQGTHRDQQAAHAARSASLVEVGDEVILRANCDAATGAALREVFDRYVDGEWRRDWEACTAVHGSDAAPSLLDRTDAQRRFDALAAIFRDAASTPADAQRPEPLVNIVIDTVTLERLLTHCEDNDNRADDARSGDPRWWRSETGDGQLVAPEDAIAAMIWGKVRRIVIDQRDGTVLDVGRRRRLFTGRARDAVLLASARCTWPGCLRPSSRSQADHRDEHQHGGATDIANGDPCCPKHNRHKSRNGYTVRRDTNGYLHHLRPDGTEIGPITTAVAPQEDSGTMRAWRDGGSDGP